MAVKDNTQKANNSKSQRVRKLNIKQKKKVIKTSGKLRGSFRLLGDACAHLMKNKKLFLGILLVYAVLYFVLVKALATNFQLSETRDTINETVDGDLGSFQMASTLFSALIGSAGAVNGEAAGVYQILLFFIISLVIIWALRQTFEDRVHPKISQAFYAGPSQIIPYILVWLVVILQLVPAMIGVAVYGIVVSNGIAVSAFEQIIWFMILVILMGVSVFFVSASLFATYIVTLPGVTPLRALRSAKQLVRFRRWMIIRKVLFLPVILLLIMALVFFPLVLFATVLAEVLFLIFILLLLVMTHAYFYVLYRELL